MTVIQRLPSVFILNLLLAGCSAVDLAPVLGDDGAEPAPAPESPVADAGPGSTDAINQTSNATGTNNDYFFTYWKDNGSVTMTLPGEPLADAEHAGKFEVEWTSGAYNFVGGKGWNPGSSSRTVQYDCGTWSPGSSNAYLTLYGWTTEPLVEYYVVDSWGSWRPPGGTAAGQVTTDEGTYDLYRMTRTDAPNITGENQDFEQYWSVRTSKRTMPNGAATITFANHEAAWAAQGWDLGNHDYQVLATEVFRPASNGSSDCTIL